MVRQRLDACRQSEARATTRAKNAKEAAAAALASRGSLAARIHHAAQQAGRHSCDAVRIGMEQQVAEWAERHERHRHGYYDDDY